MKKKKISVIIAVYNKEKYLHKCLDSILEQNYKNLEIILINDGSTDRSKEICEEYEKKDNRIKLISTVNKGASSARNLGLDNAQGEYISFIDADDYISKDFYTYLYKHMIKYNADIVECNSVKVKEDQEYNDKTFYIPKTEEVIECNNIGALTRLYGDEQEFYGKTIVVWNKLYKKEVLDNVRFEPGRIIDDESFTYKALYNCKKFITLRAGLYAYVYAEGSTMRSSISMRKINEVFLAFTEAIDFFEKHDFIDLKERAIRRYLGYIVEKKEEVLDSDLPNKDEIIEEFNKKFNYLFNLGKEICTSISVLNYRCSEYENLRKDYLS